MHLSLCSFWQHSVYLQSCADGGRPEALGDWGRGVSDRCGVWGGPPGLPRLLDSLKA